MSANRLERQASDSRQERRLPDAPHTLLRVTHLTERKRHEDIGLMPWETPINVAYPAMAGDEG